MFKFDDALPVKGISRIILLDSRSFFPHVDYITFSFIVKILNLF